MIEIILTLVLIGLLLWAIAQIPMDATIHPDHPGVRDRLRGAVAVQRAGLLGHDVPVPRL